jgi:hypothetical protein
MRLHAISAVILSIALATPAAADVVYTYTGVTFGTDYPTPATGLPPAVTGDYSTDDFVSGWLLFSAEIPTGEPWTAGPLLIPIAYSFSDGIQTLDNTNSTILFGVNGAGLFSPFGGWGLRIVSIEDPNNYIASNISYIGAPDGTDIGSYQGTHGWTNDPMALDASIGLWAVQVPEPATWLLSLIGAGVVLSRQHHGRTPFAAK